MSSLSSAVMDDHVTLRLYAESIRRRGRHHPEMRLAALQELAAFALAHDEALVHSRLLDVAGAPAPRARTLEACTRLWLTLLFSDPSTPEWQANFGETCWLMESVLAEEERLLLQQRSLNPRFRHHEERFVDARERALRLATAQIARLVQATGGVGDAAANEPSRQAEAA